MILLATAALAGCAGKNFVRAGSEDLRLGRSTYSEVLALMGEPQRSGQVIKNAKPLRSIVYVYAASGGEPYEDGVIPARAQTFWFHRDVLVGQEFISSFKADATYFNLEKVGEVVQGQSTRSDVVARFGQPTGRFVAPVVEDGHGTAFGYRYQTTRGGVFSGVFNSFRFHNRSVVFRFNRDGVVDLIDLETSASD
ncbi:hypothetical protein NBRC116584_22130 [Hydrogenophaga sp. 5NK40-0174]